MPYVTTERLFCIALISAHRNNVSVPCTCFDDIWQWTVKDKVKGNGKRENVRRFNSAAKQRVWGLWILQMSAECSSYWRATTITLGTIALTMLLIHMGEHCSLLLGHLWQPSIKTRNRVWKERALWICVYYSRSHIESSKISLAYLCMASIDRLRAVERFWLWKRLSKQCDQKMSCILE